MEPHVNTATLASGSGANNKAKDDLELGSQDYSKQIDAAGAEGIYEEDGRNGVVQTDAVFGEIVEGGPNYRAVGWLSTSILMFKAQVGLGVLSLPFTLQTLGMVPGILCIAAIGVITTWGQYMIGEFKLKHRDVYSIDDVGYKLGGRVGREILAAASWLFMTFVAGAGMLSLSVALNAISMHGACTAIFVAVAAIAAALIASIQTLGRIQGLGWVGVVSILAAIIIMTIAVGVQDRPAEAPQEGPWERGVVYFGNPTFAQGCAAVSGIVLSYAGAPTFFPMIAEMRRPQDYNKSLILCTSVVVSAYLIVGCVVYHYAGQYVASPALGSAGLLMKKVCYGLAIPGLLVSTVLYSHFPAKYIFVRVLRGSEHLSRNTVKHWVVWLSSVIGCVLFSYVVASAIPVFNGLVSLIGASVGTLVCIQPMGAMWLYDNWNRPNRNLSWKLLAAWNIAIIIIGFFLMGVGTYGSVKDIIDAYNASGGSAAWSCADNSNSVPSS